MPQHCTPDRRDNVPLRGRQRTHPDDADLFGTEKLFAALHARKRRQQIDESIHVCIEAPTRPSRRLQGDSQRDEYEPIKGVKVKQHVVHAALLCRGVSQIRTAIWPSCVGGGQAAQG